MELRLENIILIKFLSMKEYCLYFLDGRRSGFKKAVKSYVTWLNTITKLGQLAGDESLHVSRYDIDS